MAPLPENNTARLFIDYTSAGQEHVLEIRLGTSGDEVDATNAYAAMVPVMDDYLYLTDSIMGARFSAAGSNVSFPIPVASAPGTISGTPDPDRKPTFLSVTGRSADGRRSKVTLYTAYLDVDTTGFRTQNPTGSMLAFRNAVASVAVGATSISGQPVIWNGYVNHGVNAYYQRKARRS